MRLPVPLHLTARGVVAREPGIRPASTASKPWRSAARVDVDPGPADLDRLEGVAQLALGVLAVADHRPGTLLEAALHGAGVGAVGHQDLAVFQLDVGEEGL